MPAGAGTLRPPQVLGNNPSIRQLFFLRSGGP